MEEIGKSQVLVENAHNSFSAIAPRDCAIAWMTSASPVPQSRSRVEAPRSRVIKLARGRGRVRYRRGRVMYCSRYGAIAGVLGAIALSKFSRKFPESPVISSVQRFVLCFACFPHLGSRDLV